MKRRDDFEDDGRTIADMSGMDGIRPSSLFQSPQKKDSGEARPAWEDAPFTWKERLYCAGAALSAALLIALVFLAGIALVIWLITLYA